MSGGGRGRPPARRGRRPSPGGGAAAPSALPDAPSTQEKGDGTGIIRSAWIGTGLFVVATAVGAAVPAARIGVAAVDLAIFLAGCAVFLAALLAAAERSREREIGLWSLFLLEGAAPSRVRTRLLGALGAEIVVALGTAWITAALAFGCLVPMWGLAHSGLWGGRHGTFGPRQPGRRQGRDRQGRDRQGRDRQGRDRQE